MLPRSKLNRSHGRYQALRTKHATVEHTIKVKPGSEELEEVTGDTEVRTSLRRLLPPQPGSGRRWMGGSTSLHSQKCQPFDSCSWRRAKNVVCASQNYMTPSFSYIGIEMQKKNPGERFAPL